MGVKHCPGKLNLDRALQSLLSNKQQVQLDKGDNKCAKPDLKPRQMLGASSGVVRLGVVASGYRHIAPITAGGVSHLGYSRRKVWSVATPVGLPRVRPPETW